MKIVFLKFVKEYEQGKEYDMKEAEAKEWVDKGFATKVKKEK